MAPHHGHRATPRVGAIVAVGICAIHTSPPDSPAVAQLHRHPVGGGPVGREQGFGPHKRASGQAPGGQEGGQFAADAATGVANHHGCKDYRRRGIDGESGGSPGGTVLHLECAATPSSGTAFQWDVPHGIAGVPDVPHLAYRGSVAPHHDLTLPPGKWPQSHHIPQRQWRSSAGTFLCRQNSDAVGGPDIPHRALTVPVSHHYAVAIARGGSVVAVVGGATAVVEPLHTKSVRSGALAPDEAARPAVYNLSGGGVAEPRPLGWVGAAAAAGSVSH